MKIWKVFRLTNAWTQWCLFPCRGEPEHISVSDSVSPEMTHHESSSRSGTDGKTSRPSTKFCHKPGRADWQPVMQMGLTSLTLMEGNIFWNMEAMSLRWRPSPLKLLMTSRGWCKNCLASTLLRFMVDSTSRTKLYSWICSRQAVESWNLEFSQKQPAPLDPPWTVAWVLAGSSWCVSMVRAQFCWRWGSVRHWVVQPHWCNPSGNSSSEPVNGQLSMRRYNLQNMETLWATFCPRKCPNI